MTYCVGVALDQGIIFGSDSRTNAGVDNVATFCKTTVFERQGERVIVLLSSGNLAGTQAVVSRIRQVADNATAETTIWTAKTMFDVALHVSDAVREVERRDGTYLERGTGFNASFIIGGQIKGEGMRLFRTFREGNFIEATHDTPFFQTGEAKYGKPILDRVISPKTDLMDAVKCAGVIRRHYAQQPVRRYADRLGLLPEGQSRAADAQTFHPRRRVLFNAGPRLGARCEGPIPPDAPTNVG
jgi:putative proteasome-type protease